MNKRNYQKELDAIINSIADVMDDDYDSVDVEDVEDNGSYVNHKPLLVLHVCCAPCSSYCLEYLSKYFRIKLLFYNPNISNQEEYNKRLLEVHRFVAEFTNYANQDVIDVEVIDGRFVPQEFFEAVRGFEKCPEGGDRCRICYELRMREAAVLAKDLQADFFTTTLSISPLKKSDVINEIGEKLEKEYGVRHLPSDFKKREGYKRSIELSREYNLYRQNFCGCVFSHNAEADKLN